MLLPLSDFFMWALKNFLIDFYGKTKKKKKKNWNWTNDQEKFDGEKKISEDDELKLNTFCRKFFKDISKQN